MLAADSPQPLAPGGPTYAQLKALHPRQEKESKKDYASRIGKLKAKSRVEVVG